MMTRRSRTIAAVAAAALALTSYSATPVFAASQGPARATTANAADSMEFSSHRRRYHRGNAAAAAAFAAIVGGIATYAAAREYRKARERELQYRYGYYGPPYGYYYRPKPRYYYWHGW
jgi:hypothetical protein